MICTNKKIELSAFVKFLINHNQYMQFMHMCRESVTLARCRALAVWEQKGQWWMGWCKKKNIVNGIFCCIDCNRLHAEVCLCTFVNSFLWWCPIGIEERLLQLTCEVSFAYLHFCGGHCKCLNSNFVNPWVSALTTNWNLSLSPPPPPPTDRKN